jgi:hypothetical protein
MATSLQEPAQESAGKNCEPRPLEREWIARSTAPAPSLRPAPGLLLDDS